MDVSGIHSRRVSVRAGLPRLGLGGLSFMVGVGYRRLIVPLSYSLASPLDNVPYYNGDSITRR